jgi:hypothetical protein
MKCLYPDMSFLCLGYPLAVILDVLPHEKGGKEKPENIQRKPRNFYSFIKRGGQKNVEENY